MIASSTTPCACTRCGGGNDRSLGSGSIIDGHGFGDVWQELAALVGFGLALIPAGMLTFAWCERWAKKTGRLKRQG